jgi:hypothetical protein
MEGGNLMLPDLQLSAHAAGGCWDDRLVDELSDWLLIYRLWLCSLVRGSERRDQ